MSVGRLTASSDRQVEDQTGGHRVSWRAVSTLPQTATCEYRLEWGCQGFLANCYVFTQSVSWPDTR